MALPLLVVGFVGLLVAVVGGGLVARSRLRPVLLLNDAVQHVVNPLLAPVVWAAFDPRGQLNRRRRLLAAALPLTWTGVTMARGPRVDWYPYPFLDVKRYGLTAVSGVLAGILTLFSGLLMGLTEADRFLSAHRGDR